MHPLSLGAHLGDCAEALSDVSAYLGRSGFTVLVRGSRGRAGADESAAPSSAL